MRDDPVPSVLLPVATAAEARTLTARVGTECGLDSIDEEIRAMWPLVISGGLTAHYAAHDARTEKGLLYLAWNGGRLARPFERAVERAQGVECRA